MTYSFSLPLSVVEQDPELQDLANTRDVSVSSLLPLNRHVDSYDSGKYSWETIAVCNPMPL
jgi:hypothetical protein